MKYVLIALFMLFKPSLTVAQEHNISGDVGSAPGFSVTYNYKFTKRWGVGGGIQAYKMYPGESNIRKFTPGVFGDIRLYMRPEKNNQFFSFLDLGINVYKQDKKYYRQNTTVFNSPHNNGFYSGLGFGYLRRITERGSGPYVSLKVLLNWYMIEGYSIVAEEQDMELLSGTGILAISAGFRF